MTRARPCRARSCRVRPCRVRTVAAPAAAALPALVLLALVFLARPAAADPAADVGVILSRPLFTPNRQPVRLAATPQTVPRLAGLVLAPRLRLALLQPDQGATPASARSHPVAVGATYAGWRLLTIDQHGVLLQRDRERLQLALRRAAAQPTPFGRLVMMPTKRSNPQLAW